MRFGTTLLLAAVWLIGRPVFVPADTLPGSFRALEALALCQAAAGETDGTARLALLDRGLTLAEVAVKADDADAAGHFAIFCNLGRRLQLRPLGLGSLGDIRRVRRAIDHAQALVPLSAQVLTAKGTMLIELPRLLGGDREAGTRLLRQALAIAPGFADAERALAQVDGAPRVAAVQK